MSQDALTEQALQNLLVKAGLVDERAINDPEGYDKGFVRDATVRLHAALRSLAPPSATGAIPMGPVGATYGLNAPRMEVVPTPVDTEK